MITIDFGGYPRWEDVDWENALPLYVMAPESQFFPESLWADNDRGIEVVAYLPGHHSCIYGNWGYYRFGLVWPSLKIQKYVQSNVMVVPLGIYVPQSRGSRLLRLKVARLDAILGIRQEIEMKENEVPIGTNFKIISLENNPWSYVRISEDKIMRSETEANSFPDYYIGETFPINENIEAFIIESVSISLDKLIRGIRLKLGLVS